VTEDGSAGIAQRPRREHGWRLLPLALLVVGVLVAGIGGRFVEYKPAPLPVVANAAPAKPDTKKASLPGSCHLPVRQGLRGREPWLDPNLRAKAEGKFNRHIVREEPAFVEGEDGWLFWNDWQVNDASQSVGRLTLDKTGIKNWSRYLKSMQQAAEKKGSQFYVMVAPAKWDVYPRLLPAWAQELRGTVSLDLLMKAHPEIPFVDVRSPLRTAARKHDTYEALDSHWTPYGGYVAWKAATRCLRAVTPNNKPLGVPELAGVGTVPPSNEFSPQGIVPAPDDLRTVPEYASPLPDVTVTGLGTGAPMEPAEGNVVDASVLPVETQTLESQTDDTLLVLRDSTGGAISPLWEASFARTIQISHGLGTTGPFPNVGQLVRRYHPDITMLVLTERYLGYEPPS
jgi:hypothetical protein